MATWYAIYQTNDKRLVSIASVLPKEQDAKLTYKTLLAKPDLNAVMWDEITAGFIPRPVKVLVDRWEELKVHADYSTGWGKVISVDKTSMEKAIIEMLGAERYRNQAEPFEIGG